MTKIDQQAPQNTTAPAWNSWIKRFEANVDTYQGSERVKQQLIQRAKKYRTFTDDLCSKLTDF